MQGSNAVRTFDDKPAVRGPTPLLFGIIGPSGSGKTYSALRLATGMQRVIGGDIFLIDTESSRALHYAERFKFRHVPFGSPFSPLDYLTAIEHCQKKGAKIIIVDSMSHEHEGPGGVLEWHTQEVDRLMKAWSCREDKANIPAWGKPKAARRRLINTVIQMPVNFVFCFRAKDKIKVGKGEVTQMGFMPIAGEEFVYELTAKSLLLPGANGVPTWESQNIGEQMMIKLPEQFRRIFTGDAAKQLDEDIGEEMATWAAGGPASGMIEEYTICTDKAAFDALEVRRKELWEKLTGPEKRSLKAASDAATQRLAAPTAPAATEAPATETVDKQTGEVLTLNGTPPDRETAAIASLEAAFKKGAKALGAAMTKITAEYTEIDVEIPLPVEAKFTELRETFAAAKE